MNKKALQGQTRTINDLIMNDICSIIEGDRDVLTVGESEKRLSDAIDHFITSETNVESSSYSHLLALCRIYIKSIDDHNRDERW